MEGKRIDSKLLLFTLVLVLIVLLLLNWWFDKNRVDDIWNYKEITTGAYLIYQGKKVTDRELYYDLESIVNQYLNSYINKYNDKDKIMYTDYYNYLTENYKKHLSKKEYLEISENFLKKFYISIDSSYETMDTAQVVKSIYEFENNVYMCKLQGNRSGETGYIAFRVDTANNVFNIVYIE